MKVAKFEKYSHQGGGGASGISIFFKAVVQLVLIFGAETWVVTPRNGRVLGGFQYQVAQRLKGRIPRRQTDKKCYYTLVAAAREEVGFEAAKKNTDKSENSRTVHSYAIASGSV